MSSDSMRVFCLNGSTITLALPTTIQVPITQMILPFWVRWRWWFSNSAHKREGFGSILWFRVDQTSAYEDSQSLNRETVHCSSSWLSETKCDRYLLFICMSAFLSKICTSKLLSTLACDLQPPSTNLMLSGKCDGYSNQSIYKPFFRFVETGTFCW